MRENRRMLAKRPGGPRSQATNPKEPMRRTSIRVPGLRSILVMVLEEDTSILKVFLEVLRRSNILVLEHTTFYFLVCLPTHNCLIPISTGSVF